MKQTEVSTHYLTAAVQPLASHFMPISDFGIVNVHAEKQRAWQSYTLETAVDVAKLCSGDCNRCGQVRQWRLQCKPSYVELRSLSDKPMYQRQFFEMLTVVYHIWNNTVFGAQPLSHV